MDRSTMQKDEIEDATDAAKEVSRSQVKRVPAVRRAASILWELADGSTPMNLSQISRAVDVIPSTCLHILRELATARFVSYDPGSKTYELGSGINDLARKAVKLNNFADLVRPRLQSIADRFNMTATATSKIDAQHLALAAFASPSSTISIRVTLGGRVPLMSGASGRIFAAFGGIPENQIRRNFERVKWVRPIDYETWRVQVAQAVKNGYAEDCEGFVEGVSTLAVPVYSFDGTMTHTLGVFAVDSQLEEPMRQEILDALWTLAKDVHLKLVC